MSAPHSLGASEAGARLLEELPISTQILIQRLSEELQLPPSGEAAVVAEDLAAEARLTAGGTVRIQGEGGTLEVSARLAAEGGEMYWRGDTVGLSYRGDAPPQTAVIKALDHLVARLRRAEYGRGLKKLVRALESMRGLAVTTDALRSALEARLGAELVDEALAARVDLGAFALPDPEESAVMHGVRPALLRECEDSRADDYDFELRGLGLQTRRVPGRRGRAAVIAAKEDAALDRTQAALEAVCALPNSPERFRAEGIPTSFAADHQALAIALGTPSCCAEYESTRLVSFIEARLRGEPDDGAGERNIAYAELRDALPRSKSCDGRLNRAWREIARFYLAAHRPCQLGCKASGKLAAQTLKAMTRESGEARDRVLGLMRGPLLITMGGPRLAFPGGRIDRKGLLRYAAPPAVPASDDQLAADGDAARSFDWMVGHRALWRSGQAAQVQGQRITVLGDRGEALGEIPAPEGCGDFPHLLVPFS